MPDPLATLLKLRDQTVETERRNLADTLSRRDDAAAAAEAARRAITRETEAALQSRNDHLVEAFAAWLPGAKARLSAAEAAAEVAEAAMVRQRAALAAARASARAVEKLLRGRRDEAAATAARRAQSELDEAANRPGPERRWTPHQRNPRRFG